MKTLNPEIDPRLIDGYLAECPWLTDAQRDELIAFVNEIGPWEELNVGLARLTARSVRFAVENGFANVLERLKVLEALAKPMRYVIAPKDISQVELEKLVESVKNLGATVLPAGCEVSGPTVEVYQPEANEPEPES